MNNFSIVKLIIPFLIFKYNFIDQRQSISVQKTEIKMNTGINWEAEHRQTLLQSRSTIERSNQSVARSQAIANETEQIGTEVITELSGQRESLLRAKDRLVQTEQGLDKTQKIMRAMKMRILTNKFVLILIILLEIGILVIAVYIKYFRK